MPYNSCNSQLEKFAKTGYNYNNLFFKLKGEQIYERIIKKCKLRGGGASQLDGSQEFKKSRCQAVFFNVILHLLSNLKFVKERSRNRCAMTEQFPVILNLFQDLISGRLENKPSPQPSPIGEGVICHPEGACRSTRPIWFCINFSRHSETQRAERIQPIMAGGCQEVRRSSNLDGKKIRRYEGKLFSVNSLSSNPPTLLPSTNHLGGNASLIPPYGLPCNDGTNIPSLERSANELRAKQRREGDGVAVPLYASEQDRGSKGVGESMPSPFTLHPSLKMKPAFTLADGATHVDTTDNVRRAAFTLAEVLITLGIIGIVAALTMPSLIANYKKKETVTRLKKAYSVVQQAIKMSELDNGEVQYWNIKLNGREFFNIYFDKYFQYTKKYTSSELWDIAPRKLLNGSNYTGTTYASDSNGYHIMLADGVLITLHYGSENCIWVGIDTNGLAFPNQIGRDTFLFVFTSQYGLQPLGGQGTTADGPSSNWSYGEYNRDKIIGGSSLACNVNKSGYWCAALIMNDGWEMAKDYPW